MNAGRINLRALVSFLRKCDAVLTTDSGPRHLANAAGVPVVYLRNLLSLETETGSYLASEHDLVPPAENPGNLRHKNFASPEITPGMAARRIAELLPN
jgi:ADP-heptose:LPS heptosyltransferase